MCFLNGCWTKKQDASGCTTAFHKVSVELRAVCPSHIENQGRHVARRVFRFDKTKPKETLFLWCFVSVGPRNLFPILMATLWSRASWEPIFVCCSRNAVPKCLETAARWSDLPLPPTSSYRWGSDCLLLRNWTGTRPWHKRWNTIRIRSTGHYENPGTQIRSRGAKLQFRTEDGIYALRQKVECVKTDNISEGENEKWSIQLTSVLSLLNPRNVCVVGTYFE